MTRVSMTKARQDFTDIANRVMYGGQRICIEKNNKPAVAVVPIEDLELIESIEDKIDVEAALKALKEPGFITLKALKKKLGIK
ncbi:MAG: type II toxin-antitoxin system Phd/YefM family antitoxin [Sedimentisphaerales bacterium]|nr:type II toxin-antitoxin system Phd/YefM family antitoxin [Sedimentisphaerales bacterium]